jgi:hypothetical protein
MPIKKENRALYPKNWLAIRAELMKRSGGRCECHGECGTRHISNPREIRRSEGAIYITAEKRCDKRHGDHLKWGFAPKSKNPVSRNVVLTTAHLNHNPRDSRRRNLLLCCQACHLAIDLELHMKHAAETRLRKSSQKPLFKVK